MTEAQGLLQVARDWKAGKLGVVHPEIGSLLNMTLHKAGEDCVPHARSTDARCRSLAQIIRTEQERACQGPIRLVPDLTETFRTDSERERAASAQ